MTKASKTRSMSGILPTSTTLAIAMGFLNSLLGEMEAWVGPSSTAFQRDVQQLVSDLEEADRAITMALVAETAAEVLLEVAAL